MYESQITGLYLFLSFSGGGFHLYRYRIHIWRKVGESWGKWGDRSTVCFFSTSIFWLFACWYQGIILVVILIIPRNTIRPLLYRMCLIVSHYPVGDPVGLYYMYSHPSHNQYQYFRVTTSDLIRLCIMRCLCRKGVLPTLSL